MKKISLLSLACLIAGAVFGQSPVVIYNGEDINPQWQTCAVNAINNNVDNPVKTGINPSAKCVSIERVSGGEDNGGRRWSGGAFWEGDNIINISPSIYNRISLMVLKNVEGQVALEIQSRADAGQRMLEAQYTTPGQWQKLVFYLDCAGGSDAYSDFIKVLLVRPHDTDEAFTPATQIMYWDNLEVYYEETAAPTIENGKLIIYDGETVSPVWGELAANLSSNVANPEQTGINTSANCVSIERVSKSGGGTGSDIYSGGALWNCERVHIDPTAYNRLSVMVLKSIAGPVWVEVQSFGSDNKFLEAEYTTPGQWQNLIFTLPEEWTSKSADTFFFSNILVQPHRSDEDFTPSPQTMYWDNLVAYKEGGTAIRNLTANASLQVFSQTGSIRVQANKPAEVSIYSISGLKLACRNVTSEATFALPAGIYLVKAGGDMIKTAVK